MVRYWVLGLMLVSTQLWSGLALAALNIQHWRTPSGSEVYFVERHDLPMLDVSVNFAAGYAHDALETSGLAGMTRYMMTLGASGMDEETITNRFADVGAILSGSFDADRSNLRVRTLTSHQTQALSVFSAILHHPDFPEAVLKREKSRVVAALEESETEPDSIAQKTFMQTVYARHPYGLSEDGEVATVQGITTAQLRDFYTRYYTAKSAVIALMGDLTLAQAKTIAEQLSAGLPQGEAVPALAPVVPLETALLRQLPHPASQAHILVGQTGYKRGDPDFFPLYVGNYMLGGGGFVSRLTEEVREKRGLAYSVYSYFMPMAELGVFQIGLQTKKQQATEALQVVNETVQQFLAQGATEDELQAAKDHITGGFPLRIDSNSKILEYLNVIGFYQLPMDYLETFNDRVRQVSLAQVQAAFQRRVQPQHFVTVVVGAD